MAELLVSSGAKVDVRENVGRTPTHFASYWGSVAILSYFVSLGVDLNAKDSHGLTPLHLASQRVMQKNFFFKVLRKKIFFTLFSFLIAL